MKSSRSIVMLIACALIALGASQSARAANTVSAAAIAPLPSGPGQTFGVSLDISTDSPTQKVSGFQFKVFYDDTQVQLTDAFNNTGEPSAGYFTGPSFSSSEVPGLNAYKYVLFSTLADLVGSGPMGQLDFTTQPGFTGTARIALLPLDEISEEGVSDGVFQTLPVTYSIPNPLFDVPTNVYVYKAWSGTVAGTPVTTPAPDSVTAVFGVNAFDTVQGGVGAVDVDGRVMVYGGGFDAEAVTIAKSLIFEGRAPLPPSPTVNSFDLNASAVVTGSAGVTANTVNVNADSVLIVDGILLAKNDSANRATVNIANGVYVESNVVVDKAIILAGQSRAGAVIVPAAEDANVDNAFGSSAQNGIIIKSSDVTIKTLTVNGQGNPALTAGKNNFRIGIVSADASYPGGGVWNNLHVDAVDIRHPYRRGISVFPSTVSGSLIENSLIDDVRLNHGMYVAGQGQILNNRINHAFQGIVLALDPPTPAGICRVNGNTLTDIGNSPGCWGYPNGQPRGIQFNNSDSAGRQMEIKNNTISDNGLEQYAGTVGIYTRLANSDSVLEGNIITLSSGVSWADPGSQAVGMLLGWSYDNGFMTRNNDVNMTKYGIGVMVHGNGTAAKPLVLEGNTISSTLSAALDTGDGTGIYIANQYLFSGGDKSPSHVIIQNSNTISGFVTGIAIEKIPTASQALTVIADGNSITGNSGSAIASMGTGTGTITFSATNNTISGNGTGLSASGAAVATVTGNTMNGNPVQFTFGSATATTVNTFAMANRLSADLESVIDANALTGKVYIGEGSPFTLVREESGYLNVRNRIQPSATAATAGDTVRCPGDAVAARVTYPEQISINKALVFLGEPGDTAVAGPATTAPSVDGQNVVGNGFSMVSGTDNVAVRGFLVRNHASGGDNATGAGVWTWTDSDGIAVADCDFQACANGAILGWTGSSNTLDGWNIAYNTINVPTTGGTNGAIDLTNMINTTINHNTVVGGYTNMILASDSNSAGPTGLGTVVSDNSFSGGLSGYYAVGLVSFNVQPLTGVVIRSNNITPPENGIGVYISPQDANFPISGIVIGGTGPGDGNTISGSCKTAVYGYGGYGPLSNLTVSGNTIAINNSGSGARAVNFNNVAGSSIVEANTISKSGSSVGDWYGVQVSQPGTGAIQIHRNTINGGSSAGTIGAGLYLENTLPASARITATENIITGFLGTNGRAVLTQGLVSSSILTVHGNDLSGNTRSVQNAGAVLNASSNWHGTNTEVGVQAQVLTLVDFTPWLDVATDTDAGTAGFQGDFSYLNVAAASPQTGVIGRIQEGVNLLADGALTGGGRKVDVMSGTYVETDIAVAKAATIDGQGTTRDDVIVNPPPTATNPVGFVITSDDVTMKDLTVSGIAGKNYATAIRRPNTGLWNRTVLNNVQVTLAGGAPNSAVDLSQLDGAARSAGNVVTDCGFLNCGFAGLHLSSGDTEVTSNTFNGMSYTGIYVYPGAPRALFTATNNTFLNSAIGVRVVGTDPASVIGGGAGLGNTFTLGAAGNPTLGIAMEYDHSAVQGNTFTADGSNAGGIGNTGVVVWGTAQPALLTGNTFTGAGSASLATAIAVIGERTGPLAGVPGSNNANSKATVEKNSISGFGTGVALAYSMSPAQAVTATVGGTDSTFSNEIVNCGTGVLVGGPFATATIPNNSASIHGCAVGVDVAAGAASVTNNSIYNNGTGVRTSNAAVATVTGNTMYGNPVQFAFGSATATTVNTLAMASRLPADLMSVINANTLTGKVYIGEGSPFTLVRAETGYINVRNRIQPSATAATVGDTVRCPGDAVAARVTYPEQISINKALVFLGEPGDTAVAGPATTAPSVDGQNVVGNGFAMVSGTDNVAVRGFFVRNHASGGNNATGAGVWTSTDSDGITVADCDFQACANGAVFGWTGSSNTLDGWNIAYNMINVPTTGGVNGAIDLTNMINTTINNNTVVGGISNLTLASDSSSAGPTGLGTVVSGNSLSGARSGSIGAVSLVSYNVQPLTGVVIRSNNITPTTSGYGVYISPQGATFPISGIVIGGTGPGDGNTISGPCKTAVYGYGGYGPLSNLTVSGNTMAIASSTMGSAVNFYNVAGLSIMEANTISKSGSAPGGWYGVQVSRNGTGAIQIHRNTINGGSSAGTIGAGLYLENTLPASARITATENIITGFLGTGGRAVRTQGLVNSSVLTLHGNDLSANTRSVQNAGAVLDASSNWHGTNTEVGVQGQVLTLVDYTPWLDVAMDTDVVTAGFQGDFSYLHAAAASPQTGLIGRIQEGVNLLADGALVDGARTVSVKAGTYSESDVNLNKAALVEGAQAGVDARTRLGAESTLTGGFSVTADDVTLDGLKVAGAANAVLVDGGLTGVTAKNISVDIASGNGIFAGATGNPSELVADKNLVVGAAGVGIGGYLANSVVTNNEVRDSAALDATGIGGQFAGTSIEGNKVDSITSGSALALLYGPSTGTLVQVNRFTHATQGVYVDAAAPPDASVLLTRNHISEEEVGGFGAASIMASTLTANGNWWGHVFGPLATTATPLNNATGRGTVVTGAVAFNPWYIKRDLGSSSQALRAINDRDGDGIWDADEDDNLNNTVEPAETNRELKDTDSDGVEDGVERRAGTDPRDILSFPGAPTLVDADGDGLPASIDLDDTNVDTDGDRIKDGYEYSHGTNGASTPAIGDVSNNGTVTINDVTRLNQLLVAARLVTDALVNLDNADVNRNGNVSNADAITLRRFVTGPLAQPTLPY